MIIASPKAFVSELEKLRGLGVKEKSAQMAIARSLGAGATIIARASRSVAPKGVRANGAGGKTYGKTGLLKKSIKAKSGVSKKGTAFSVVGPSRDVMADVTRGRGQQRARPSNYAHLVEFGFSAHSRVPLVTGRQQENIVKKGVLWKASDLAKYTKKRGIVSANLTKGKLLRQFRFMRGAGQGTTRVAARPFMSKGYASSQAAAGEAIVSRYAKEYEKLLLKLAKGAKKK